MARIERCCIKDLWIDCVECGQRLPWERFHYDRTKSKCCGKRHDCIDCRVAKGHFIANAESYAMWKEGERRYCQERWDGVGFMYELVFPAVSVGRTNLPPTGGIRESVYLGISEIPTIRFKQHFFGSHNRAVRAKFEQVRDPRGEALVYNRAGISPMAGDAQLEFAGMAGHRVVRNMPDFKVYGYPSLEEAAVAERARYFVLKAMVEIELLNIAVPSGKP